ncbi:MAG: urea ABC transporter permease subunit UrtB [Planctomycetota bacterium]|nr:MAG: urea ABC transporter permease subunit UrtB [Planctomycetota bacterium]
MGDYTWGELQSILIMQGFAGFSLFAVFLLMALGLSIIFGQMKVINMAHGEFLTAGAYTTVFLSTIVSNHAPGFMPYYFLFAIVAAFIVTFILGWIVEWGLIRFLYNRPLDTLLATWGLSMIFQEIFRQTFGAREASARMPEWLQGAWMPTDDIFIPIAGLFLLTTALVMTGLVYLMMFKSRWGLRVRATVLNRDMAGAVGINTKRTDRMTFAIGCGLAGVAGAAFTTIGSVSPSAGQLYIVDTFMVVVLGGAGSLLGTLVSAFGIAQAQSIMEFFLSGVFAKVLVLLFVVIVLIIKPSGLFVSKVRK